MTKFINRFIFGWSIFGIRKDREHNTTVQTTGSKCYDITDIMEKHLRISFVLCCVGVSALLFYFNWAMDQPFIDLVFLGTKFKHEQQTRGAMSNTSYKSAYVNSRLRYNSSTSGTRASPGRHEILWWNEPRWMTNSEWNNHCNLSLCEYPNCIVTLNKSSIAHSSAVIVSIVDGGATTILSQHRNKDQPWVFFTLESPASFLTDVTRRNTWDDVFNWSMTYHRDADIFIPYGWLGDRTNPPNRDYSAIFRSKTKQVAWIVSHCNTISEREHYVEQLKKHIPVDIFGTCAGNRINDGSLKQILTEYKFYLGFENAFCRDYVTEKYFHYLKYDLIVIVRGLSDYNNLLPHHTFINTENFGSIESLADYLNKLAHNETEYIHYLKEKDKYFVYEREWTYCDGLCTICEKVNSLQEKGKTYSHILDWTAKCKVLVGSV